MGGKRAIIKELGFPPAPNARCTVRTYNPLAVQHSILSWHGGRDQRRPN